MQIGELYKHKHYGLVLLLKRSLRVTMTKDGQPVWDVTVYLPEQDRQTSGLFTKDDWTRCFSPTRTDTHGDL